MIDSVEMGGAWPYTRAAGAVCTKSPFLLDGAPSRPAPLRAGSCPVAREFGWALIQLHLF